ncbi:MAG: protein translocase subunit SecF [Candidatus Poribacteria bacterium]|nr:protein translocase subunit SecF [Candidatus Poribacteria bacterium]
MELLRNANFDFISKYRKGFMLSSILIVIGLIFLGMNAGPNFGIDFRGGVKIQAKFNRAVTENELKEKLESLGFGRATIQVNAIQREASISLGYSADFEAQAGRDISEGLIEGSADWNALPQGVSVSAVGPSVGKDLKWAALWSVLSSIVILLAYISWRFEFRFAIGAIAALIHDVLITLGVFSVLSKEINLPTIAAFLTIIGYSLNDTIVVFDRIRENTLTLKGIEYSETLNRSINQSLSRTVITSLTTFFVVLVIFFLSSSGEEINTFALALIVGVIIGTYSSIFVASPILNLWNLKTRQSAA